MDWTQDGCISHFNDNKVECLCEPMSYFMLVYNYTAVMVRKKLNVVHINKFNIF
jgi:hypothetical protein